MLSLENFCKAACFGHGDSFFQQMMDIPHCLYPEIRFVAPAFFGCKNRQGRGGEEKPVNQKLEWNIQQVGNRQTGDSQMAENDDNRLFGRSIFQIGRAHV